MTKIRENLISRLQDGVGDLRTRLVRRANKVTAAEKLAFRRAHSRVKRGVSRKSHRYRLLPLRITYVRA